METPTTLPTVHGLPDIDSVTPDSKLPSWKELLVQLQLVDEAVLDVVAKAEEVGITVMGEVMKVEVGVVLMDDLEDMEDVEDVGVVMLVDENRLVIVLVEVVVLLILLVARLPEDVVV